MVKDFKLQQAVEYPDRDRDRAPHPISKEAPATLLDPVIL